MPEPYRVLVTGSRTWRRPAVVRAALDQVLAEAAGRPLLVVHGAAHGADGMAARWATERGVEQEPHPADWDWHGRAAGYIRNGQMVAAGATVCLAFVRDSSRGASHAVRLAGRDGIPVLRWSDPPRRLRVEGDLFHGKVPPGAVYVGRGAPGLKASPFANPHPVGKPCRHCAAVHTREESVSAYGVYLSLSPELVERARVELAWRDLACWCPLDQPCHADVLLEVANG